MYRAFNDLVIKRTGHKNGTPVDGFAARLKHLRVQRNLSQVDLAQKTGLSNILVSRYERSAGKPSAANLKRLADVLEVSSDYLLEGTEEGAAKVNLDDRRVLNLFQTLQDLPGEEKDFILKVLARLVKTHSFETLAAK